MMLWNAKQMNDHLLTFNLKPYQTINILPREKHKRIQRKKHASDAFTFKVFKYTSPGKFIIIMKNVIAKYNIYDITEVRSLFYNL